MMLYIGKRSVYFLPGEYSGILTIFAQKCQSFLTSWGGHFRYKYHIAPTPKSMPNTATLATQTSKKQGVKSYLSGLRGPHPSLFLHSGC